MKWEVKGAFRDTGEDAMIVIEADTRDSAERRASRRGIVISSVLPSAELTEDDSSVGLDFAGGSDQIASSRKNESREDLAKRMLGQSRATSTNDKTSLCPQCGSDQLSRAELIHAHGTSSGRISAVGLGASGSAAFVSGGISTQSDLAKKLAPPVRRSRAGLGIAIASGFISLLLILIILSPKELGDRNALAIVLAGTIVMTLTWVILDRGNAKWNEREFGPRLAQWNRTWCCMRCGATFLK